MNGKKKDIVLFGAILPPVDFRITAGSFPLGLLALSSVLKARGIGVEVISGAFIDARKRLEEALPECRYLGISAMSGPYLQMGIEVAKLARKKYPHVKIIWGGVHATLLPEETIREPYVDVVVRGMGEETLPELIEAWDTAKPLCDIKGVTFKDDSGFVSTIDREMPDINSFPSFDYTSFLPHKDKVVELPYISSRGCPWGCTFCVASKLYKQRYFFYSAERMFEEIRKLSELFSCHRFVFWDDNLFVVKERLKRFCELLIEHKVKIKWSAFCHCDLFLKYEDALVELMKEAGLENISFGAESGSSKILDMIKKKITQEQILATVKKATVTNLNADFTFMTGFPQETVEDFKITLQLFRDMLKINPDISIRLFAFTPYPKIPLLEEEPHLAHFFPKTTEGWAQLTYQNYLPQWVSAEHRQLIDNVVWMVNFLSRSQRPRTKNIFINGILYLYHLSALFRLKHNLLKNAWEWKIFKFIYNVHTKRAQRRIARWAE
jgi:radical SAM superfamily enzyme YgiQ (UPF0313 family)